MKENTGIIVTAADAAIKPKAANARKEFLYHWLREYMNEIINDALENGDADVTIRSIRAELRLAWKDEIDESVPEEMRSLYTL